MEEKVLDMILDAAKVHEDKYVPIFSSDMSIHGLESGENANMAQS